MNVPDAETEAEEQSPLVQLSLTLGQVRAEYATDETVFSSFSQPVYWGELVGTRPCILVGGRGTGKTTTLRGLAYGGQYSLHGADIARWDAVGAYWRVDSMAVSAFSGRGVGDEEWGAAFSHYVNLRMVGLYLGYCSWRDRTLGKPVAVDPDALRLTAVSLNMESPDDIETVATLSAGVARQVAVLESRLNGPTSELFATSFSLLGRPIGYLLSGVDRADAASHLPFTFCVDEFENLRPYQQRIMNTVIKHVGDSTYTLKIGVRDSEQRERETLAHGQTLIDPADYTTVDIVRHLKDQSFSQFAAQVCERRLSGTSLRSLRMTETFPSLSLDDEATLLGADRERSSIRRELARQGATEARLASFDGMSPTSACLVGYWARAQGHTVLEVLTEALDEPFLWDQRLGNYAYALLFTLRKGRRGIRKYYAGWQTYCQLADGNIRLLLELVYEALRVHLTENASIGTMVSYEIQTRAAATVGNSTLRELQGRSGIGGQLTYLTLSLGRIFNVFAAVPEGHAPEVNQIRIERDPLVDQPEDLALLLSEAISNGCLLSFAGNKQERVSAQTKSSDYQLHPIFAPYFEYSHRRKRRIQLTANQVVALATERASRTISSILQERRRPIPSLPEQLNLYEDFFDADS